MTVGLLTPSVGYKPFRYPWAYEYWKKQQQLHWLPEEIPLGEDIRDWNQKLSAEERNLLTQIFRFFTQADIEVQDNYQDRIGQVFKPTEVKMMTTAFSNMETVHIAAYSHLIDTIGLPETEYSAFMDYKAMKDKHDYLTQFNVETPEDTALTLATFGGFVEGLQLFASFAMLMNFPRFNLMKGMGQVVSWSVRDETLHCEGVIRLYHEFCREQWGRDIPVRLRDRITEACHSIVTLEDAFIEQAFGVGGIKGMDAQDIKQYIRYIADWRLSQLGLGPVFGISEHPLPWLTPLLNGVEHAEFFGVRATEYSKGATTGTWEDVWSNFDATVGRD
jgi:ribonucleoside-diphosphate reductase beta chain